MTPYSQTDKTLAYLLKQFARLFGSITAFDELNVINKSHEIYSEALRVTEQESARLVKNVYDRTSDKNTMEEPEAISLVVTLALAYNPVTKYIFRNEIDRKRSRFAEGVIASDAPREEIELAKRLLIAMTKQFADDATFDAVIQAYKDDGESEVEWVTAEDDRRCKECAERHGKVYPIDAVPPKPHLHCRCYVKRRTE